MGQRPKVQEQSGMLFGDTDPVKTRVLRHLAEGRLVATRHHKVGFIGSSGVWARFSLFVRPDAHESVGFVQCNDCLSVLRYDSHRTGTSSLKRHRCTRSLRHATCKVAISLKFCNQCGTAGGTRIGRGSKVNRRNPAAVLLCAPQVPT
jgi:hypothetical protein